MDIINMINAFEQSHQDAAHIAHIALHDYNIYDGHLRWLIDEYIPANREEYIRDNFWYYLETDNRDLADEEIDEVVAFLNQLLAIPESARKSAVEQYLNHQH